MGRVAQMDPATRTARAHPAPIHASYPERAMSSRSQVLLRGCVMGLVAKIPQGLVLFAMSEVGLFVAMGVAVNVPLDIIYSTKHVALGAGFGALFAVPVLVGWPNWLRGLLVGLCHAAGTLFFFNPIVDGVGFMGLDLGALMPVVVVVANLIWGVLAGIGVGVWNRLSAVARAA